MDQTTPHTIDEYIATFPQDVQVKLEKIRMTIRDAAPDAGETIKYQIPTFTLNGNLVSFAAYKQHIGVYPVPTGDAEFNQAVSAYKVEKSTMRIPMDKPIPFDLISRLVQIRIQENLDRAKAKGKK